MTDGPFPPDNPPVKPAPDDDPNTFSPAHVPLARPVAQRHEPVVCVGLDEMLLRSASKKSVGVDLGLIVLSLLIAQLAIEFVMGIALGLGGDSSDEFLAAAQQDWLVPILAFRTFVVLSVIGAILHQRRQRLSSVGMTIQPWPTNFIIGLASVGVSYALIYAWQISLLVLWPSVLEQFHENAEILLKLIPQLSIAGYAMLAILIAVNEELLFRGFLMTRLRRVTGSWTVAVLVSTAVFTGLHSFDQTPAAMVPITILSLVFSLTTIWRRSIIPAIVGHCLFDLSQFIGLSFFLQEHAS